METLAEDEKEEEQEERDFTEEEMQEGVAAGAKEVAEAHMEDPVAASVATAVSFADRLMAVATKEEEETDPNITAVEAAGTTVAEVNAPTAGLPSAAVAAGLAAHPGDTSFIA